MSLVMSVAVGNGDMFYVRHDNSNFTIIDCNIAPECRRWIVPAIQSQITQADIVRFISTHPDQDHVRGLAYLDDMIQIPNFYCVWNGATKLEPTIDFQRYCQLRDGPNASHLHAGCTRRWLNLSDDQRGSSGIHVHWPRTDNPHFISASLAATLGATPNNLSPVITYTSTGGITFAWMGDLETDFMERIEDAVVWPRVDVLFAPHHGRDSGRVPRSILTKMNPRIIVIGEARADFLHYYCAYNTITQNSAGTIAFECVGRDLHVYVTNRNYSASFLAVRTNLSANYLGTLCVA